MVLARREARQTLRARDTAALTLERLRALTPDGQTFSAGIAVWDAATDPSTAIAAADEALYVAKRAGRDRVVVHRSDRERCDREQTDREQALQEVIASRPQDGAATVTG